jgi:hypothetical protein
MYMSYTSMTKSDKERYGLKSHAIPTIIAIAYLVDSIEAEMSLLRMFTLLLAGFYVASIATAVVRRMHERHVARKQGADKSE